MVPVRLAPGRPATPLEHRVGRFLAICAHPVIAWRVSSARDRLALIAGYGIAAYALVLTALLITTPSL